MIDTREAEPGVGAGVDDDLGPTGLLASIRERKATEDRAAADVLTLAARWADLHPPESIHSAASFTSGRGIGLEHEEPIAGQGCPTVAEFCVAELGTTLGISTTSAKRLIGHALELRHRLPRLWAQVQSGRVPAWRARTVAEATIHTTPALTLEAAGWVDAQVAAVAGKIGPTQLDRLVAETIRRFELAAPDPAADPEDGYLHVDPRHATINRTTSTTPGPCTSRPTSTSPTPSTSTAPSPTAPPPSRPSAPPTPSTPAAPPHSATSPAPRPPSTS